MKKIQVEITGTTPLLMNSPKAMLEVKESITTKTAKQDYNKEAEKVAYRNSKGNLFVPSTAIKGTILNACSFKKIGKFAAKSLIAGGTRISSTELEILDSKGKPIKDYSLDIRSVVIRGSGRVIKARPKIESWKLNFEILYNEELIADNLIIKQILKEAGERVGILDFRPAKSGDFGCFEITNWKECK